MQQATLCVLYCLGGMTECIRLHTVVGSVLLYYIYLEFQATRPLHCAPLPGPSEALTSSLAVPGLWVHLIARVALALEVALIIDADLAAGIWVLTLVNVCGKEPSGGEGSELAM